MLSCGRRNSRQSRGWDRSPGCLGAWVPCLSCMEYLVHVQRRPWKELGRGFDSAATYLSPLSVYTHSCAHVPCAAWARREGAVPHDTAQYMKT